MVHTELDRTGSPNGQTALLGYNSKLVRRTW